MFIRGRLTIKFYIYIWKFLLKLPMKGFFSRSRKNVHPHLTKVVNFVSSKLCIIFFFYLHVPSKINHRLIKI